MPQTSVSLSPEAAFDGHLTDQAPYYIESCTSDEANGIPFGRAVVQKAAATYGNQKTVDLVASAAEAAAPFGVAVHNPTYPSDNTTISDGDGVGVARAGVVLVKVEDAVTAGGKAFIRHTAGASLTALGRFRSDDGDEGSGPLAAASPYTFEDSASAGGYARVWLGAASVDGQKETVAVTLDIPDVSTGDEVYVAAPVSGRVVGVQTCLDAAISTADAGITFEIDGTAITGAAITVAQSGSAAGDVDEATPTDANVVTKGQTLSAVTDGNSTGTALLRCTFIIEVD